MVRHSLFYLILSILIVVFSKYANLLVIYIYELFLLIKIKLSPIFQHISSGMMLLHIILLVIIPIFFVGVIALCYRIIKGKEMPYFLAVTWICWLILVFSTTLTR